MRRVLFLVCLLCASCSDGAREGVPRRHPDPRAADEAVDPGVANDRGDGTDNGVSGDFPTCRSASDCARGVCLGKLPGEINFCLVPCGTVAQINGIPTMTCARGEQCAFMEEERVGICARPCMTDSDCPRAELPLVCRWSERPEGRFCLPRIDSEETTGT